MTKDWRSHEVKPLSLTEARKKISEHKPATRIEGSKQGQAVSSVKVQEPKGKH